VSATEITVIGNVVTSPTRNRTQNGSVTNFRVAATERRFDSATGGWIDGHTFYVDVECWGELGGNVSHSISKGDPVVVVGVIRTDEWESDQGRRSRPQVKAEAVAPNLARGTAEFRRSRVTRAAESGTDTTEGGSPASSDEEFPSSIEELRAGRDYDVDAETLEQMNADLSPEPAHA
jgi:single-strand DNA-binding protein